MTKTILIICLLLLSNVLFAQHKYWQQNVNFTINVSLNDTDNTLDAFETIEYTNHSPDTLRFIWFHIWPNAYKNDRTAFSEQLLKERRTDFYFSKPEEKGYINQLDFKADGSNATIINDTNNIDIIKIILPKPLPPENKTIITTPFKVRLPYNFSRGGHVGNDYQVTQWFPKPAVYDWQGWHQMPYLDQGEFYAEFGSFDVEITAPSAYVIAATGTLQDAATSQQLKEKGHHTIEGTTKTWHYKQDSIHDFAWFASKDFIVKHDTAILPSKKIIDVFSYYREGSKGWNKSIAYAKDGLRKYSTWLGDYPYASATVVQGSENQNSGGMEYPTITLITTQESGEELDVTIVHEIGHNWFYGALASNERTHPWMDEGMNSFYEKRYEKDKYDSHYKKSFLSLKKHLPVDEEEMFFNSIVKINKDQPIETPSEDFTLINYDLVVYYKTSKWMEELEDVLGKDVFENCMRNYYRTWKFKHPYPEDFKQSIEQTSRRNLDSIFNLLHTTGPISSVKKKTIKPSLLFNFNDSPKYNYINIAPAIGYNSYDNIMAGALIHNYTLPFTKVQYVGGAMYATSSKKINGFAHVSYNIYHKAYHLNTSLGYISYSQNDFTTSDNNKLILPVKRWTPSVKITFFDKDVHSSRHFTAQWKTFLLNEGTLNFKTVFSPTDTTDVASVTDNHSYINRLSFVISDDRILFPYSLNVSADQGRDFVRAGLTAKYFFNYPDGKSGMTARFFAGKFMYLNPKKNITSFNNERYFLNISAPSGNEDYTYSDYFIGRNEFDGWKSQQVMERDGFFKVNTNLLSNKIGKSDNWIMSVNLASDLPDNVNPLRILPITIPIKIFADVGTYAEAWRDNPASGRFIYDAGIQLPLFNSFINIYVPLIYSKVFRDYYKTTVTEKRFLKTISFNIDLQKLQLKSFVKEIPL